MVPSDQLGSDGPLNLYHALLAASSECIWGLGVLVCFRDQLFAASEVCKVNSFKRDALTAPERGPVAEIVGNKIHLVKKTKRGRIIEGNLIPAREVSFWATLGGAKGLELLSEDEALKDWSGGVGRAILTGMGIPDKTIITQLSELLTSNVLGRVVTSYALLESAQKLLESGAFRRISRLAARINSP